MPYWRVVVKDNRYDTIDYISCSTEAIATAIMKKMTDRGECEVGIHQIEGDASFLKERVLSPQCYKCDDPCRLFKDWLEVEDE